MKTLKAIISFLSGLLTIAKWLPFLGKYKEVLLVASTVLTAIGGLVTKCDQPPEQTPATTPTPQPQSTPVHSPTPLVTPTVIQTPKPKPTPAIILDRTPVVSNPFTVRYTAPYQPNTHLWADKWRLGYLGRDVNGQFVLYAVVLNTAGKRLLTVRNAAGDVLASKAIEVKDAK